LIEKQSGVFETIETIKKTPAARGSKCGGCGTLGVGLASHLRCHDAWEVLEHHLTDQQACSAQRHNKLCGTRRHNKLFCVRASKRP
jgi:hypothetical protein